MNINNNWKVESNEMGITLLQKKLKGEKSKSKGEEYWDVEGYYPTCQAALRGLVRAEVNGTGLKDFKTICNKLNEIEKTIKELKIKDGV